MKVDMRNFNDQIKEAIRRENPKNLFQLVELINRYEIYILKEKKIRPQSI